MTTPSAPRDSAAPQDASAPAAAPVCSGCGHALPQGADRCAHCGLAFGEEQRCPHCGAVAPVEKSSTMRTVCAVCGRPRIRVAGLGADLGLAHDAAEQHAERLRRAGHADRIAATWRAVGFAAIGFGLFGSLVLAAVLAVAPAGAIGAVVAVIAAVIPILVGIMALRRGGLARRQSMILLDEAWADAAAALARARGKIDAPALARATGLDEASAEALLGKMTVQDRLAREVTAEGGLSYKLPAGAAEGSPPEPDQPDAGVRNRLRVDSEGEPGEGEATEADSRQGAGR